MCDSIYVQCLEQGNPQRQEVGCLMDARGYGREWGVGVNGDGMLCGMMELPGTR